MNSRNHFEDIHKIIVLTILYKMIPDYRNTGYGRAGETVD
jgi:hypothetical protein